MPGEHVVRVSFIEEAVPAEVSQDAALLFVAALLTASPSEPVGEDAALEVAAEVALDLRRHALAHRVGFGRLRAERFEVVVD